MNIIKSRKKVACSKFKIASGICMVHFYSKVYNKNHKNVYFPVDKIDDSMKYEMCYFSIVSDFRWNVFAKIGQWTNHSGNVVVGRSSYRDYILWQFGCIFNIPENGSVCEYGATIDNE